MRSSIKNAINKFTKKSVSPFRNQRHEKIETTMIYLEKVFAKERHAIHQWKPEVFGEYI